MKENMKLCAALLFSIVLMVVATGCSGSRGVSFNVISVNCITGHDDHSCFSRHDYYTGDRYLTIRVDENEKIAVDVEIETESGELDLDIGCKDKEAAYMGRELSSGSFTVYLSEPGTYDVHISGSGHKGKYTLNWEKC